MYGVALYEPFLQTGYGLERLWVEQQARDVGVHQSSTHHVFVVVTLVMLWFPRDVTLE